MHLEPHQPQPEQKQPARFDLFRRFRRGSEGTTAVEFALVFTPFIIMIFAIIEISLIFFGTQMLETQTADSARLILTGQQQTKDGAPNAQNQPKTAQEKMDDFKKSLCDANPANGTRPMLSYLFDCSKVIVDVRSYSQFSTCAIKSPIVNGKVDPSFTAKYEPGGAGDTVVVRVMYRWDTRVLDLPHLLGKITFNMANIDNNQRLLMATAAFKNEPFSNVPGAATGSC